MHLEFRDNEQLSNLNENDSQWDESRQLLNLMFAWKAEKCIQTKTSMIHRFLLQITQTANYKGHRVAAPSFRECRGRQAGQTGDPGGAGATDNAGHC